MIVKDRVARGDNKYLMKQLNDGTGRIELTPSPDEVIEEGTVLNKSVLQPLFDGLDKIATVETVVNQGKQEIQSATNEAVERLSNAQPESNPKIYTTTELSDPQEGKIYNVKITENTSTINEKPVYKENTTESVTLKAGKVATVYFSGGNFFYKANASGDAIAEHVLAGKTFSNSDDTDITGTMPNHGGKIFKPSTANIIIPKGFHDGTGYVEGDPDLVSGNIVQGKNIFGVSGNALTYTQSDKARVANAVTSKGVATSTTASWGQIEQNIRNIKHMLRTSWTRLYCMIDFNEKPHFSGHDGFRIMLPSSVTRGCLMKHESYAFDDRIDLTRSTGILPFFSGYDGSTGNQGYIEYSRHYYLSFFLIHAHDPKIIFMDDDYHAPGGNDKIYLDFLIKD